MELAARIGTTAASADSTDWKQIFSDFLAGSFAVGTDIHLPCKANAQFVQFRTKGLSGLHLFFDGLVNTNTHPIVHNNLGLYQNNSASLSFPDAVGVLGQQLFNTVQGYNGRVDIYLPGIIGITNSRNVLLSECDDTHMHFSVTCAVLQTWLTSEVNLSQKKEKFTLHGTDGTLKWNGTEWAFTPSDQLGGGGGGITADA